MITNRIIYNKIRINIIEMKCNDSIRTKKRYKYIIDIK